jgi:hypothetical protein
MTIFVTCVLFVCICYGLFDNIAMSEEDWEKHKLLILDKLSQLDKRFDELNQIFIIQSREHDETRLRFQALELKVKIFLTIAALFVAPLLTFISNFLLKHV